MCPAVSVRAEQGMRIGAIEMTPIMRRIAGHDIGIGFSVVLFPAGMGTAGTISLFSMGEGDARYAASHDIVIVADDSIRIAADSRYDDRSSRPQLHMESINGRIHSFDLERLANAKRIKVTVGSDSYDLAAGQVQAVRAVVGETTKPVSNRSVPTGCAGPNPGDLQYKWATQDPRRAQRDSIGLVKVNPISVAGKTYFEFQVEKPARVITHGVMDYPLPLRNDGVEGTVLAQFVILEDGTADPVTFHVLQSSHDLFTQAVRAVLPQMRFSAAEIDGKKVRQLVQLPFEFKINASPRAVTPSLTFQLPASVSQVAYTESQVDKPARNPNGSPVSRTIPAEVVAMFGGERVLEFVVNADGKVAAETVRLVSGSSPLVASMPIGNLSTMFFIPAELHGERVRQVVQLAMPVSIRPAR